jgi:hypothetical protein
MEDLMAEIEKKDGNYRNFSEQTCHIFGGLPQASMFGDSSV